MIDVTAVCLTTSPRRADMLDAALTSFFGQTLAPERCEIIVVNDGTPLISTHPRCLVLNIAPGLSLGEKRNLGARHARGWAVACWDDDDVSLPERLEHQLGVLRAGASYTRASSMWVADESLRVKGLLPAPSYATSMVTRAALDLVAGYPDISYREDMELFIRLAIRKTKMVADPPDRSFYVYRRHGAQMSTTAGETDERSSHYDPDAPGLAEAQRGVDGILAHVKKYVVRPEIPRIIHQIWIGPKPRPAGLMDTWARMNPTFEHVIWDNERVAQFGFRNAAKIAEQSEWNGKADIMRYEILDRYGGILVDADAECVRALPDWMLQNDSFASWENEVARPGMVAAGYVGATPGNRLMKLCVDECARTDMFSSRAWVTVGPAMLTRLIRDTRYPDIRLYPSHYFMPKHHTGIEYRGDGPIFAKQHWGSTFQSYDTLAQIP